MGCCSSTARSSADQISPYSPSNPHASSSSHPITTAALPQSHGTDAPLTPRTSNRTSTHNAPPQPLGLSEQFNAPLRPHTYTSSRSWTRRALAVEREAFFDTRVTGRPEIWHTLRMATDLLRDGEVQTAQGVLDAAGVTVPTGDLVGGVYDEGGEFYQLPEAVIADPENVVTDEGDGDGEERKGGLEADAEADGRDLNEEELERRREEKGKGVLKSGDLMRVKARLSDRGGPDVLVTLSKEQSVRVLVRKIQEEAGIPGKSKVRIAYLGKILKDGETLLAQGWREGHVVNALVFL